MFIGVLPTETTMRVIDWMIVEGSHVMFSVALALVELNRESLTAAKSFEEAFTVLNNMTEAAFDADTLIEVRRQTFVTTIVVILSKCIYLDCIHEVFPF